MNESMASANPIELQVTIKPMRRRLPDTRRAVTHKFNVGGYSGYLSVGLFDDGTPGELFITMAKEGSTIGGLMDAIGILTSTALQYGVPLEALASKFRGQRFAPMGCTTNATIPVTDSLTDYIFRWMEHRFCNEKGQSQPPESERGA